MVQRQKFSSYHERLDAPINFIRGILAARNWTPLDSLSCRCHARSIRRTQIHTQWLLLVLKYSTLRKYLLANKISCFLIVLSISCLVCCMHNHFSVWYREIWQLSVPIQTHDQTDASIKLCYSSRKNQQDFFISWGDRRVVLTRYIFPDWIHILDLNLHPWSHNCCKSWALIPWKCFDLWIQSGLD